LRLHLLFSGSLDKRAPGELTADVTSQQFRCVTSPLLYLSRLRTFCLKDQLQKFVPVPLSAAFNPNYDALRCGEEEGASRRGCRIIRDGMGAFV
jgi:hypothetical protein